MSKFIDRLNRVGQPAPQSIGFRTAQAESPPVIQLIARLSANAVPTGKTLKGADAAIMAVTAITSGATTLKKLVKDVPGIDWGAFLTDKSANNLEKTTKLGADFVIFPATGTPVSTPPEDGPGIIIEIETSLSDMVLRTINDTPVDAVLIRDGERGEGPLTWAEMLSLQRVVKLLNLPLLVTVPSTTAADELQVLSEMGIAGIVVETDGDRLSGLRKIIDMLPAPIKKHHHRDAMVPQLRQEVAAAADDDDDGDDYDDEEFD